ncbi:MAG: SRPBCC domain-containing protein [Gammaproteobacteria bacterium]|nr:SRPBCC domain-containing protein [Gammaproteobacteria bacterium]
MADVHKSIWIDAPPEVVFEYFIDPEKFARWCGQGAEFDPVPQGKHQIDMGEIGVIKGRFLRVEAPAFVSWQVDSPPGSDAPPSIIEVTITPEADGSRIDFKQTGLEAPFDTVAPRGLDHHLARLSVAATGGSPAGDSFCKRKVQTLS